MLALLVAASPALADSPAVADVPTRPAQRPHPTKPVRAASTTASVEASTPAVPPPRKPAPGITLPADAVSITITTEANASRGKALDIVSVAPDLAVGITSDFTMAVIHSSSALTGFRGSAGAGICVTDPCSARYANVGLEALYNIARGDFAAAADVGIIASQLDPLRKDAKVGFKIKVGRGRLFAVTTPNVWLALDDAGDPMKPHEHQLFVPFSVSVKVSVLSVGLGTGLKGPLDHFGMRWSVPLGASLQVALDKRISLGSSLVFGKLVGGDNVMGTGADARAVQVWIALTSG